MLFSKASTCQKELLTHGRSSVVCLSPADSSSAASYPTISLCFVCCLISLHFTALKWSG
ncbi:hypothetical protein P389DRAFT_6744 [Cystobasidium minutum MCA 4210]|uniref:uncharacterized protein n=1 Tax=Cystobasidium minutum MCA 4210 TaxID=1397322 RepID=UPI0034CFE3F1|eukprot:jgi/Rhomi1/6744/CE6743_6